MNGLFASSATIGVVISLIGYYIGVLLKKKFKSGILNPLLISIILVIIFLVVTKTEYQNFNASAKYLSWLLTPATVSLAIPLYTELDRLKKNIRAIAISITVGTVVNGDRHERFGRDGRCCFHYRGSHHRYRYLRQCGR